MKLELRRVIVFALDMEKLTAFYEKVLGLSICGREPGWVDFDAGACHFALHKSHTKADGRRPKLAFYARDVAATRAALIKKGARMGPVKSTAHFDMCDGKDPEGNPFQVSSRA